MSWNQPYSTSSSLNGRDRTKLEIAKYLIVDTTRTVREIDIRESIQRMQRAGTTIVKYSTSKVTARMVLIVLIVMI